ncbi:MAG TPA: outer membrane lipoprotein chaperone LolA [Acidiferrobacteraceae bacterium]|nr:outer membrane lipoprotein chaperone LolA [Acidiferrobacteraceae bacterium]
MCAWASLLAAPVDAAGTHPLQHFFKDVRNYSAQFTQVVYDRHHEVLQRGRGRMWIERPDRFRWEYVKPYPQTIVGDGRQVFVYDAGLAQVTVRPMAQALGDTPALILSGRGRLQDHFRITHPGVLHGVYWVDLKPRRRGGGFQDIRLGFTRAHLTRLVLRDSLGQITDITLTDTRENRPIPGTRFRFKAPPGADVVHE